MHWNQLGHREKQLLALLRRADGSRTARELLEAVRADGETVAYTTISAAVDRLAEKELVERESERARGSLRYRYSFDAAPHRAAFVRQIVGDVDAVLGAEGLDQLATAARGRCELTAAADERGETDDATETDDTRQLTRSDGGRND